MLKKLTLKDRQNGELEVRRMSEKAQIFYNNSGPITVAKLSDGTISIRGNCGNYDNIWPKECEEIFENLYYTIEGSDEIEE